MIPYSVYLHIPYCKHRCGYCDFNTFAGLENTIPYYVEALCAEIDLLHSGNDSTLAVHSVFFGGGTPSLLPINSIEQLLETLDRCFNLLPSVEITLEANPGTLTSVYLKDLFSLGINRLSLGMQSAHPFELHVLEREHTTFDVINSVKWIRQAGFENLNLDLIFGIPGQTLNTWVESLKLALNLHPEHFSLYALSVEEKTPLERWIRRGLIQQPDPDLAAEMYEIASELLSSKGYTQYEISNWAGRKKIPPGKENEIPVCRHNMQYWKNLPYLGLGAGAHGFANGIRTENVLHPRDYIQRLHPSKPKMEGHTSVKQSELHFPQTYATKNVVPIDKDTEMRETLMMGLRLTRLGVSKESFKDRFGKELDEVFGMQIERLVSNGLLERSGEDQEIIRLTPRGRLLGNLVFAEFV